MTNQTAASRRELEAQLIARAWKDKTFKQELLRDPKGVITREVAQLKPGAVLPADLEVRVVEETLTTMYLVLPPAPATAPGQELSDEDLERVAFSGTTNFLCCMTHPTDISDLLTRFCCTMRP